MYVIRNLSHHRDYLSEHRGNSCKQNFQRWIKRRDREGLFEAFVWLIGERRYSVVAYIHLNRFMN